MRSADAREVACRHFRIDGATTCPRCSKRAECRRNLECRSHQMRPARKSLGRADRSLQPVPGRRRNDRSPAHRPTRRLTSIVVARSKRSTASARSISSACASQGALKVSSAGDRRVARAMALRKTALLHQRAGASRSCCDRRLLDKGHRSLQGPQAYVHGSSELANLAGPGARRVHNGRCTDITARRG